MSKTFIGGAVCREIESEAPARTRKDKRVDKRKTQRNKLLERSGQLAYLMQTMKYITLNSQSSSLFTPSVMVVINRTRKGVDKGKTRRNEYSLHS